MLQIVFDIVTIVLLCAAGAGAFVFHRRLTRLREALAEAGQILPKLDAAVSRMNESASGFSARIQSELQGVEDSIGRARRLGEDLAMAGRAAEEAVARLEQQMRQARRLEQARANAIPRALAEPKGFAEQIERRAGGAPDGAPSVFRAAREDRLAPPEPPALSIVPPTEPRLDPMPRIASGPELRVEPRLAPRAAPAVEEDEADYAFRPAPRQAAEPERRVSRFAVRREPHEIPFNSFSPDS